MNPTTEKNSAARSNNIIIQAENVMLQASELARQEKRDPSRMLRVLAVLAAPVFDPADPEHAPSPLDLHQEWHVLAEGVRQSNAPILLARLQPPTLESIRSALSPRAGKQEVFPHILHFSGHAWKEGLLLEDELGQVYRASTSSILKALKDLPQKLDLLILNGCESAASASSVAQSMVEGGLARAVVGHERPVLDSQAIAFAHRLYSELTGGFPLEEAVARAKREVTTHEVVLTGEKRLVFQKLSGGAPVVDKSQPPGNLPPQTGLFMGRGRELVKISMDLKHPPAVIVISGPPGIGKTSLVLEAAYRNAYRFPGGVAYASAPRLKDARKATAATADDMLKGLAEALDLAPKLERLSDELLHYTAIKPTLLILDNLETLSPEEMARLGEFLRLLGEESAAIAALRPASKILEDLPASRPLSLHHGLTLEESAHYALFLARQRQIPLTRSQAESIAGSVEGHLLLLEKIVAEARRRDLEELLEEVEERRGNFVEQLEEVYSWSAARLDDAGKKAWRGLLLFPEGNAPEGPLREAAGRGGLQALQEAALADYDPVRQLWLWHATVAEYAQSHWPISPEELPSQMVALAPAWTRWLDRLPPGERKSISRIENARLNLEAMVQACPRDSDCLPFLDALKRKLPLPDRTLILRELIAEVCLARLEGLEPEEGEEKASRLNDLAYSLSALGQRADALIPAQEATDIYRKLAQANPEAFLPDLAMSLNNLGIFLSNLGQREAALAPAQEAVDIRRKLAQANPEAFLPNLANSLGAYGSMLRSLEQYDEAAVAFAEGLKHIAAFYQQLPDAFVELAWALQESYLQACQEAKIEPDEALLIIKTE